MHINTLQTNKSNKNSTIEYGSFTCISLYVYIICKRNFKMVSSEIHWSSYDWFVCVLVQKFEIYEYMSLVFLYTYFITVDIDSDIIE